MNYTIRDYDAVTDWKAICQVHDRSEGFIVTRTFDSDNAGYPCTVSRRQRQAPG
jgi:hypothetical protein